jgi:hypothetical protein
MGARTLWESPELSCIAFQRYGKPAILAGSKLIRVYCMQPYQDQAPAIARVAGEIVDRYESVVGRVEPLTLNISFAEGDLPGYFSDGLILLSSEDLQNYARTTNSRAFYKLLAHEIGHLWWHSSMFRLEDLSGAQWYVEGFTEYASVWSTREVYGVSKYERRLDYAIELVRNSKRLKPLSEYSYWDYAAVTYYKGFMMLESLRRLEGEEAAFRFMRSMRDAVHNAARCQIDAELAIRVVSEVFGQDYSGFLDHWIRGVEPVELQIIDLKETGTDGMRLLTLKSNQTLPMPLEIAIRYPDETEFVTASIKAGRSEITVPVRPGASMVELDPRRAFFRTEPSSENPSMTLEPVDM